MIFLRSQKGATLLEVMLALAISAVVVAMSLRMYQSYKIESEFDQLQANVNALFDAMGQFYKVNCRGVYSNSSGGMTSLSSSNGALNPARTDILLSLVDPYAVSIATDLIPLAPDLAKYLPQNPLVDSTVGEGGYVLQFNPSVDLPGTNCSNMSCGQASPTQVTLPADQTTNTVFALKWSMQVAVKLKNPALANLYQLRMKAECVSEQSSFTPPNGGIAVTSCDASPSANGFLVWERLPSFSSSETLSPYWVMMPTLKLMNTQYTHDQMFEFSNGDQTGNNTQFYLCGG